MDRLKASEAVYGFAAWLTGRDTLTIMGGSANSSPAAEAAHQYVQEQGLSAPRDNYTTYLTAMPQEGGDSPEELLNAWEQAKSALEIAKGLEARLRKQAIAAIYPDGIAEGANTIELADGVKLTATGKINYRLDSDTDKVEKALDKLEKAGPEGKLLADRLVSWKPSLAVGEYRKLDDKYRKIVDAVITTSEGTPTLELKRGK